MSTYLVTTTFEVINDSPERIDFHVESGDYFSYLATKLGFLEEFLMTCGGDIEQAAARKLRHDLRFVQANYTVVRRRDEDIQTIHGSGNLLAE